MGSRIEPRILAKTVVSLAFSAHHSPQGFSVQLTWSLREDILPMPRSHVAASPNEVPRACVLVRGGGQTAGEEAAAKKGFPLCPVLCPCCSPLQPCICLAFLLAPHDLPHFSSGQEFFMMLCCLPYTTLVHYGTCPFCTYQYSGFNKNNCPEVIW